MTDCFQVTEQVSPQNGGESRVPRHPSPQMFSISWWPLWLSEELFSSQLAYSMMAAISPDRPGLQCFSAQQCRPHLMPWGPDYEIALKESSQASTWTYVWRLSGWARVSRSAPCKARLAHGCCLRLLPALEISCSVSPAPHMPVPGVHFIAAAVSLAYFCQHRGSSQKWRLKIIHLMQPSWTSETWIIFTTPEDTEKPTSSLVSLAESQH